MGIDEVLGLANLVSSLDIFALMRDDLGYCCLVGEREVMTTVN